ncbi:MAG: hypothetical protein AB7R99_30475, partial [Pseudonocardia sp.]
MDETAASGATGAGPGTVLLGAALVAAEAGWRDPQLDALADHDVLVEDRVADDGVAADVGGVHDDAALHARPAVHERSGGEHGLAYRRPGDDHAVGDDAVQRAPDAVAVVVDELRGRPGRDVGEDGPPVVV